MLHHFSSSFLKPQHFSNVCLKYHRLYSISTLSNSTQTRSCLQGTKKSFFSLPLISFESCLSDRAAIIVCYWEKIRKRTKSLIKCLHFINFPLFCLVYGDTGEKLRRKLFPWEQEPIIDSLFTTFFFLFTSIFHSLASLYRMSIEIFFFALLFLPSWLRKNNSIFLLLTQKFSSFHSINFPRWKLVKWKIPQEILILFRATKNRLNSKTHKTHLPKDVGKVGIFPHNIRCTPTQSTFHTTTPGKSSEGWNFTSFSRFSSFISYGGSKTHTIKRGIIRKELTKAKSVSNISFRSLFFSTKKKPSLRKMFSVAFQDTFFYPLFGVHCWRRWRQGRGKARKKSISCFFGVL